MLLLSACILSISACGGQGGSTGRGDRDAIDLDQDVTSNRRPLDPIFIDFEKNWRKFISTAPELTQPVVRPEQPPKEPWDPVVVAECVFSADAGVLVPQVTITWNEPVGEGPTIPIGVRQPREQAPEQQAAAEPRLRVDLAVHHNGFARNYYSTALSTAAQQRFNLPSNSGLVADTEAVMLTGPALFPKLMNFRAEMIQDRDSARQFKRHTLVLRDLSQGLTYTIRLSSPTQGAWTEDRQYAFLTPVCPESF